MIIHVMNDGTVRNSVEGVKIPNKEFYRVLFEIQKKIRVMEGEIKK